MAACFLLFRELGGRPAGRASDIDVSQLLDWAPAATSEACLLAATLANKAGRVQPRLFNHGISFSIGIRIASSSLRPRSGKSRNGMEPSAENPFSPV